MIFFVGEKPSAKNKNPEIPFVGTQSYKRLLEWIWELDISITDVILCNIKNVDRVGNVTLPGLLTGIEPGDDVIALGKTSSKALRSMRIAHFTLPHPSGLNRQNNDAEFIKSSLKECKEWLDENAR